MNRPELQARQVSASGYVWIKRLIWLYLILLIVEGALRRWIFPSFAAPLLLVRDPVALLIVTLSLRVGLLRRAPLLWIAVIISVVAFILTMLVGHRSLYVAIFGMRITLLHLPLLFVFGRVLRITDVVKMGRVMCVIAIPMTLLIAAQFFLPQSHWINAGIGGEGTAGFSGTAERFRAPGTFSFTLGLTQFYSLVVAFLVGLGLQKKFRGFWWIVSVCAVAIAVPISISRSLLLQVMLTTGVLVLAGLSTPKILPRIVAGAIIAALGIGIATCVPAFHEATTAFMERWTTANEIEGGVVEGVIVDRFLGGLWGALTNAGTLPFAGFGVGLGTNAGAALRTGERTFLIAEGEWLRIVGEMGPFLGLVLIVVRVCLGVAILRLAWNSWRAGNPFPLLLSTVSVLWIAQGDWGQPTSLGFAILAGGLSLGANRVPPDAVKIHPDQSEV